MHTVFKIHRTLFFWPGFLLCLSLNGQAVEYSHPLYGIGFEATPNWDQDLHDYNGKVFQLTNPNNNMLVNLSFVPECKNAKKHLKRMSGLKGLICKNKPYDTILNDTRAVVMQGVCLQEKIPFRRMVIGIPGNNGLYMMEISCPEDCYINHKARLNSILGSIWVEV